MNKLYWRFMPLLFAALPCAAQNNAIFTGGPGDGWASGNHVQQGNNIFTGGAGDGWATAGHLQPENNIYTGGAGDGWASGLSNMVQIDLGTMIGDVDLLSSMHAYPNPTSGLVNIDLNGDWGDVTIEVLSVSGQLVRSERHTETRSMVIDVPGASGPYIVRLSTGTGEHTTFRVLKR